ncbi:type II secretion system F family protein [Allobranchiibius huperziae]|uniref:Tight adherence protein C n=1 Tax=Allobranchiibius huperziae TaxID=1874116 RepID=A0A853DBA0_9MICO|nr:type II secretion system F family protein [Allobranchiibius huperziae]NYJ73877.1 tight adherence protein C [Allobranchiibius huperziae]
MTSSASWAGALVGLILAAGLALMWLGLPVRRRPGLEARIAPYVDDTPRPSRLLLSSDEHLEVGQIFAPLLHRLGAVVERVLGGATSVRRRLERAGLPPDVEGFRAQQALWGVAAGFAGTLWVTMQILGGGTSVVSAVGIIVISVAAGVVARDQMLTRSAERREAQILAEFPAIAEMLALAITAGEGAAAALERVTKLSSGQLSGELARCLGDARSGYTLPAALEGLADRTGIPGLARFVDGVVVAVERGTPLADVMRAQAQDARDASKQALIELGGRREITMMIPVVFLVLPVTVAFAIYPGLSSLNL